MGINKNQHLECVLKSHNIENDKDLIDKYREKRDEIKQKLSEKFNGDIFTPLNSGSLKKHTAINLKFDLDIVIPFKKGIILSDMFDSIYKYFDEEYRKEDDSLIGVHKQKVSIGLQFQVESQLLNLDIVPGKEINDYEEDGDLNLFVNQQMGFFDSNSYIKTNIQKQIDHISSNKEARETIKLLKVWKRRTNQSIKSFLIELITIRAFEKSSDDIPSSKWEKLKLTLEYIKDNIKTIRLTDPGNSNNNICDSLSDLEKDSIAQQVEWVLDDISNNEESIKTHFPENPDYPCDDKNAFYVMGASTKSDELPNNDFGS